MARAIAAQCLGEPAQDKVTIRLEDHVDEVDDDHAADVAQPHLPDDLFGSLEVVAGHRLFEVSARAGELAGVHVDDGHRLGVLDDQRSTGGQPHLAVQCLCQLLVDPVNVEDVRRIGVGLLEALSAVEQVGCDASDVVLHLVPGTVALDDELLEVFVEEVTDNLHEKVRLFVQRLRRTGFRATGRRGGRVDGFPLLLQTFDVGRQLFGRDTFGCGADDHTRVVRNDLAEDLLEAFALGVGELAADPGGTAARHVHQVPAGQGDLRGQTGTLVPDRVLADLDQDLVTGTQGLFDLA